LSAAALGELMDRIEALEVEAVGVCLLHSYVNDAHEKAVAAAIHERFPRLAVSISSRIPRGIPESALISTPAARAYGQPLFAEYLDRLESRVRSLAPDAPLRIMVSSGGFTSGKAAAETPILLLESGPAGGVLSALNTARMNGLSQI